MIFYKLSTFALHQELICCLCQTHAPSFPFSITSPSYSLTSIQPLCWFLYYGKWVFSCTFMCKSVSLREGGFMFGRVWLFATPWTVACQAPLSTEFSRQEYWSGLPFPMPGDIPNPGIEPTSLVSPALADRFFTSLPMHLMHKGSPYTSLNPIVYFCLFYNFI